MSADIVTALEKRDGSRFNDGLEAAYAVVCARINYWQAKRARTHYPVGMVESELRLVEQDLFKAKRK